jgi:hypothetical protein
VLHDEGERIGKPLELVAIALDKDSGTLHKHGSPEYVEKWCEAARTKFRTHGYHDMAAQLVVITGRFPLEELNRCLRISGYAGKFYGRISNVARVSPMIIPSA